MNSSPRTVFCALVLLLFLFAVVAAGGYLVATGFIGAAVGPPPVGRGGGAAIGLPTLGSLRSEADRKRVAEVGELDRASRIEPCRYQGRCAATEADRRRLSSTLRAPGLHAGPARACHRASHPRPHLFLDQGFQPEHDETLFLACDGCRTGPVFASLVHPRRRPIGASRS